MPSLRVHLIFMPWDRALKVAAGEIKRQPRSDGILWRNLPGDVPFRSLENNVIASLMSTLRLVPPYRSPVYGVEVRSQLLK